MKIGKQFKNSIFQSNKDGNDNSSVDGSQKFRAQLAVSKDWIDAKRAILKQLDLDKMPLPEKLKEIGLAWEKSDHGRLLQSCSEFKAAQRLIAREMGLEVKQKHRLTR